jgi:hypothetical protein
MKVVEMYNKHCYVKAKIGRRLFSKNRTHPAESIVLVIFVGFIAFIFWR